MTPHQNFSSWQYAYHIYIMPEAISGYICLYPPASAVHIVCANNFLAISWHISGIKSIWRVVHLIYGAIYIYLSFFPSIYLKYIHYRTNKIYTIHVEHKPWLLLSTKQCGPFIFRPLNSKPHGVTVKDHKSWYFTHTRTCI